MIPIHTYQADTFCFILICSFSLWLVGLWYLNLLYFIYGHVCFVEIRIWKYETWPWMKNEKKGNGTIPNTTRMLSAIAAFLFFISFIFWPPHPFLCGSPSSRLFCQPLLPFYHSLHSLIFHFSCVFSSSVSTNPLIRPILHPFPLLHILWFSVLVLIARLLISAPRILQPDHRKASCKHQSFLLLLLSLLPFLSTCPLLSFHHTFLGLSAFSLLFIIF